LGGNTVKTRSVSIQKKALSAIGALAVSALFVGVSVGPAMSVSANPAYAAAPAIERTA
jgi:hypothetical protein